MEDKILKILNDKNIEAIILTDYYNKRYLTGFTGTTGIALITKTEKIFYSDARYTIQATEQTKKYGFVFKDAGKMLFEELNSDVTRLNITKIGLDYDDINLTTFENIKKIFKAEFVSVSNDLKKLRQVKTKEEIENIKKACEITDIAFNETLKIIKPGITEKEIAAYLEYIQRKLGATDRSFETIVASGYRSSMPHGVASDKIVNENEFITLDFGCLYNGYASDMTRTVYLGNISEEEKKVYDLVLEGQKLGVSLVKKGVKTKEIDLKIRELFKEKGGYDKYFTHSTGHSFGLEVHETPSISKVSEDILEVNQVITIEPGIYIDGKFGVRIEDDVLITEEGNEILNKSNKELICIPVK